MENKDLQELPPNFYEKVMLYIRELKEKCNRLKDPLMIKLVGEEMRNVKNMLKQLIIRRTSKIISSIFEGIEIKYEKLPEIEKYIFKAVESLTRSPKSEESVMGEKVEEFEESLEESPPESDEDELVLVRFIKDVPEITGIDLKEYGPFKKGDVGTLPLANARLFLERGFVELIESKQNASK